MQSSQSYPLAIDQHTSREADATQVKLLRQTPPERLGQPALMLSDAPRQLARRTIDRAQSHPSEFAKDHHVVRVHYRFDLADTLDRYWKNSES